MSQSLIKNVSIVDGSGGDRYKGHVLVSQGRIERIYKGHELPEDLPEGCKIVDGTNRVCTPGFIDTHSHSDLSILVEDVLEPKIRQGITTEILGQDGIAMAPLPELYIRDWQRNISGLDGYSDTINWHYETVGGYLKEIEKKKPSSNYSYLVPHGNVRLQVMGFKDETPDEEQLQAMKDVVEDAMEQGCLGLSSGLIYIPCTYAATEELIELCKVVKAYDGVFVVHQRSEADDIFASMEEIFRIGRESGVRLHFSHFKICGKKNWKYYDRILKKLDQAKEEGLKVSFDMYPYTAGSTMLSAILPPWMHVGGTYSMLRRLKDFYYRREVRKAVRKRRTKWDNFISFAGVGGIYITSVASEANSPVVGMNLVELGAYKNQHPLEAAFDLILDEKNEVGMIDYYGNEEHLKGFIVRDEMNGCTDGLLGGKPHPRAYGAFPKFIDTYVTGLGLVTFEDMIHKLTKRAAENMGIKERGQIKEGYWADLLLLEEGAFKDKGTYLSPKQFPEGIHMVMVNGEVVFDGRACKATASGVIV